jgi:GxxExxY protein
MMIEFRKAVIPAVSQSPIEVLYEDEVIGEYFADVLVDRKVIVENKCTRILRMIKKVEV